MSGERFNMIAGGVEALTAAGKRAALEAERAAARFDDLDREVEAGQITSMEELLNRQRRILAEYRAAQEAHARALDDLSAVLKGGE